ncbi:MAG TPA: hypothetical protein VF735_11755 [Pyrinomonadaceae bacterium]
MERIWNILAGLGVVVAAASLLLDNINVAFVAATLGLVAWFLGLRDRLRQSIAVTNEAKDEQINGEIDED